MLALLQAQNEWLATVGFVPTTSNPADLQPSDKVEGE
jgi:hypothetical protein